MADTTSTTPLLTKSNSPKQYISTLEEMIEECVGDFGWRQFLQAILIALAYAFDAQQSFISIFTDGQPTWHCTNSSCNSVSNICHLPRSAWSWDLPAHTSIVSDWSLECTTSILTGLPASSFYFGSLAGGLILATIADSSLGRKNMLLLSCLIMSVAGLLTTVSTNIWVYSTLRFISGFGRATIGTCILVLSSELVGKRWRGQVGTIGFFFFTIGFASLPAIAYLNRGSSWRILYLWTSIPTALYCVLVYFFILESPRWLFVQGRRDESLAILKRIAPPKKGSSLSLIAFSNMCTGQEAPRVDLYSAIKILLEKQWAFRRLAAVGVLGFGIGMVYYGMPLGLGNMNFNLYLSVTINALSELPATLVTFILIGKVNRKSTILGFTILSGISSVMCVLTSSSRWHNVQILIELLSFFSACTSCNVLLIYTLELFPTCVRNSSVSIVRLVMVFGGIFSPVLIAAGRGNEFVHYGVFGLTIGLCGLFVRWLPETRGGKLCDSMDEEEQKEKTAAAACLDSCVVVNAATCDV